MSITVNSAAPPTEEGNSSGLGYENVADIQNRFLTLLLTQLRNQDPTNPLKNEEITSQMAQLSTVSGISQLNDTMTSLLGDVQYLQSMQATNLIGKTVVAPGEMMNVQSGSAKYGVYLDAPASNVEVQIKNSAGEIVNTLTLHDLPEGVSTFTWDGKTAAGDVAPDGKYTFSVAASEQEASVASVPLSIGLVSSITANARGAQLDVPPLGSIRFSDVVQIL